MVYKCFDKKSSATCVRSENLATRNEFSGGAATRLKTLTTQDKSAIEKKIISNQQLAEEIHKTIIRKFSKKKVYSSFKDYTCGADLAVCS